MADRADQFIRDLAPLVHPVSVQRLVVHAALEEQMNIAFPGEADASVELNGAVRDERRRIRRRALGHSGRCFRVGRVLVDTAGGVVKE